MSCDPCSALRTVEPSYPGFLPSGSPLGGPKPKGVLQGFLQLSGEERGQGISPLLPSSSVPLSLRFPSLGRLLGQPSALRPCEPVSAAPRVARCVRPGRGTTTLGSSSLCSGAPTALPVRFCCPRAGTVLGPRHPLPFTRKRCLHIPDPLASGLSGTVSEPSLGGRMVRPGPPAHVPEGIAAAGRAPRVPCLRRDKEQKPSTAAASVF